MLDNNKPNGGALGKRLKYFRVLRGYTQVTLAKLMGYESMSSMISQIERGKAGMSIDQALNAARILNVHPSVLLTERNIDPSDLEIINDLITIMESGDRKNLDAIGTLIKASK